VADKQPSTPLENKNATVHAAGGVLRFEARKLLQAL